MKVLMLGWEFPPHISGGLGTACAGITQALERQQVDILFVVPKLHGQEQARNTLFIDASSIPIPKIVGRKGRTTRPESVPALPTIVSERSEERMTRIEVTSPLSPYNSPSLTESQYNIEHWNYSISRQNEDHWAGDPSEERAPYPFTGAYGRNLLEEVDRYAQVVSDIARKYSFDIIHAHDWMTYKAGLEAKKATGKPLVIHVHATEIDRSGSHVNPVVFNIEQEGMTGADKVVTVSEWTKNIALRHYSVDPAKLFVVHNGVSTRKTFRAPGTGTWFSSPTVTFLGRITHQKGPLYFVQAARKVHERFPDTHFVVAGAGDLLPIMIERVAELKLSPFFHFTGFLRGEEIDKVWSISSVYVMPSVSEPFGIAPLEAIEAGVPVILSKQAGVSEVMPHAIKVDFWNCDALAEAICNVLRFKSLANTLKKNGTEEIKDITWDKAGLKLTTLYHEVINQHNKRKKPHSILPGPSTRKAAQSAIP